MSCGIDSSVGPAGVEVQVSCRWVPDDFHNVTKCHKIIVKYVVFLVFRPPSPRPSQKASNNASKTALAATFFKRSRIQLQLIQTIIKCHKTTVTYEVFLVFRPPRPRQKASKNAPKTALATTFFKRFRIQLQFAKTPV